MNHPRLYLTDENAQNFKDLLEHRTKQLARAKRYVFALCLSTAVLTAILIGIVT